MTKLLTLCLLLGLSQALELRNREEAPQFATSAADGSGKAPRPPGYRNAWDDCGGAGASATERMRNIAAKIKGFAKPIPFVRNAVQDCGGDHGSHGTKAGPGEAIVYPGPEIWEKASQAAATADDALASRSSTERATKIL